MLPHTYMCILVKLTYLVNQMKLNVMCGVRCTIMVFFDQAMIFVSAVLGSTAVMPPMNSTFAGSYPVSGSV